MNTVRQLEKLSKVNTIILWQKKGLHWRIPKEWVMCVKAKSGLICLKSYLYMADTVQALILDENIIFQS